MAASRQYHDARRESARELVKARADRIGLDADALDHLWQNEMWASRLAQRIEQLADMIAPDQILGQSALIGDRVLEPARSTGDGAS